MSDNTFFPKLKKLLIILAISGALIFFNPAGIFNPVRSLFLAVTSHIQKSFSFVSFKTNNWIEFMTSISKLKKENADLIKENNKLVSAVALLSEEKRENEILREQLDLLPRDKYGLEACFVIGQDPQTLGSWILIDKGRTQGIKEDMPVIVGEGILIGKISEVQLNTAKVNLLTNSSSTINALDLETGSRGVVKGEYGLGVVMDMVAQTDAINQGDTVVTSGLGSQMPKGLLIGKIQEVRTAGDKLFQNALVIPRVKYNKLEVVFVVK